jgi:nitroreductase/NAD-dependent dihydropyrimidine dehydrogenase PreA subunit
MRLAELPRIDAQTCIACGACIEICPDRVLGADGSGKAEFVGEGCMMCGHCYAVCPVEAVRIDSLENDLELVSVKQTSPGNPLAPVTLMGLVDVMRSRRSCRKFKPEQLDFSVLKDLVTIGRTAPSGTNSQGWQFFVLPERQDVMKLGEATAEFYRDLNKKAANPWYRLLARMFAGNALGRYYDQYYPTIEKGLREWDEHGSDLLFHGAPAAIVVAADTSSSCPSEDALLATQNILLAAHTMGLGTCLIGFVVEAVQRDKRIASLLRLGKNEQVYSAIACGYPAVTFKRPAGRKPVQPRVVKLEKSPAMQNTDRIKDVSPGSTRTSFVLYSFGFKHGVPVDANMVWDVRFLPNPYWQEALRPLSGQEAAVSDYVIKSREGKEFLKLLKPLLKFLASTGGASEKKNMRLAIGCTGGRHRSVAVVEELQRYLAKLDIDLHVFHRDLDRE